MSAWHERIPPIPFVEDSRVRVTRFIPSAEGGDSEYAAYVGRTGRYAGVWRNGAGEPCPSVSYPCSVVLDGMDEPRSFRVEELEPESPPREGPHE